MTWIAIVFVCAMVIRLIPQLEAFPYPIGYDVVNYYIPVTAHFQLHWPDISTQYPLYAIILRLSYALTGLSAVNTVSVVATLVYSLFVSSVYLAARRIVGLTHFESIFIALFVGVQLAVLRTTWDLHRDMFALTACMFSWYYLSSPRTLKKRHLCLILGLCALAAASDRMIGLFFSVCLFTWCVISQDKRKLLPAVITSAVTALLLSLNTIGSVTDTIMNEASGPISQTLNHKLDYANLPILFLVVNGTLLLPAALGFYKIKFTPIKVALLLSLGIALIGIAFPSIQQIGADRWIILSGVFMSIHAAYGIVVFTRMRLKRVLSKIALPLILCCCLSLAVAYALMSYSFPIPTLALFRNSVQTFVPTTMQFSTLDTKKTSDLIDDINYINNATAPNAIIVGDKTWSGFMEMYLSGNRTYRLSAAPADLLKEMASSENRPVYYFNFGDQVFLTRLQNPNA